MTVIANKAASVAPPTAAADATGKRGVYRYATTNGGTGGVAVPSHWGGQYITIQPVTADVQWAFSFGSSAQTLTQNQTSALGTGNIAAGATAFASTSRDYICPRTATFINWVGTGTGFVEFFCSEAAVV